METSTHICGFWFHIKWNGNTGIDQKGNKWINLEKPEMIDKDKLNVYLDQYNNIKK